MKTNEIIKQISFEDLQKFVIAYAKQDVQFETSIKEKFAPATDDSWLDRIMDRFATSLMIFLITATSIIVLRSALNAK